MLTKAAFASALLATAPFLMGPTVIIVQPPAAAGASISVVQSVKAGNNSVTSLNLSLSPTAGNAVVVAIAGYQGSIGNHAVSDNIDSTTGWEQINTNDNSAQDSTKGTLWVKFNMPSGVTTITATGGTGTTGLVAIAKEVTVITTNPDETNGEAGAAVTEFSTGDITNTAAAAILFAFYFREDVTSNPAGCSLNATGTDGTWIGGTDAEYLVGTTSIVIGSLAHQIVATSAAREHVFGSLNASKASATIIAVLN